MDDSTRKVLAAVARHLGVDVGEILSRDRTQRVVHVRWAAAVMLKERCRLSYRQLGAVLQRDPKSAWRMVAGARQRAPTRDLVEMAERHMQQESPRTRRAVIDVEEAFRRAREDAGAPPRANATHGKRR